MTNLALSYIHPDVQAAYAVLEGKFLDKPLALKLAALQGQDILDLIALAHRVKTKFAPQGDMCTIMNAKSGACPENCRFCAQSAHHQAEVEEYPLVSEEQMLADAKRAYDHGVRVFGLVTSGTGYEARTPEFDRIVNSVRAIRRALPEMHVCVSVGMLTEPLVEALAAEGVYRYNLNLQVNPAKYHELISSTHSAEARIATIRLLQAHGIGTCTGGILGLGESMEDRVELAYAVRDLNIDVIPLNVLIPIPGTPLENQPLAPVSEIAKTFAIFRLVNPAKVIKFAAGRETRMKDFQGLLMLAGANGFLTGGYLTTRGRDVGEDRAFWAELEKFNGDSTA
jgi:biotin synthase